jgi:hypothetical protein
MRPGYWILGLITLIAVVSIFVGFDPEHAERLSEMRRNATLTGETRQLVLIAAAVGLGAFIVYLTMSRR